MLVCLLIYLVLFTFIEVDDVGLRVWLGLLQLMDDIHLYACMFCSFQFIMVDDVVQGIGRLACSYMQLCLRLSPILWC
jgi:hypothetical protein